MTMSLKGRTAVITGAANGIGLALVWAAVQRGMRVALIDAKQGDLDKLAAELPEGALVAAGCVDVRRRHALQAFAGQLAQQDIALVFANAGIMRAGLSWELDEEDWAQVFDINVKGAMNTVSVFMPQLLAQQDRSRVIFTGSTSAFNASPNIACYSASKHALWGLAEAMELELRQQKAPVSVSFLAPSGVKTGLAAEPLSGPGRESQQTINELLDSFGVPAESVAEASFAAIEQDNFWILPHPDFKAALQARAERVAREAPPRAG